MPVAVPVDASLGLISRDKKNVGGSVKWSLLDGIGRATFDITVPKEMVIEAFASVNP